MSEHRELSGRRVGEEGTLIDGRRKWRYVHLSDGREPSCIHEPVFTQPMSMCSECQGHPELIEWRRYWADMAALSGSSSVHEHSWRVEGDDNYEPFHNVCETCGEREPDPFEADDSGSTNEIAGERP